MVFICVFLIFVVDEDWHQHIAVGGHGVHGGGVVEEPCADDGGGRRFGAPVIQTDLHLAGAPGRLAINGS